MEVSFMADTFSITSHHLSIADALQRSSVIFPIDAVAPPAVRSKPPCRVAARRALLKSRRRTKRRSPPAEGGDDAGFFAGEGERGFPGGGAVGGGISMDLVVEGLVIGMMINLLRRIRMIRLLILFTRSFVGSFSLTVCISHSREL